MSRMKKYTAGQKLIARILYIGFVITVIMIIGSVAWTISDVILRRGKMEAFLKLGFGFQLAIVGAILAILFFILIMAYGLFKKGVVSILRVIFRPRELEEKFKNRTGVKLAAGLLMFSLFAIIIGIVIAICYEIFRSIIGGSEFNITGVTENLSGGQIALIISILSFIIVWLAFALNYLWFNGYGLIIKLLYTLEEEEE